MNLPKRYYVFLAVFVIISTFIVYRQIAIAGGMDQLAPDLKKPLTSVSWKIRVPKTSDRQKGYWVCNKEGSLPENAILLIQPDQYLKRIYRNKESGYTINLLVPFSRRAQQSISHEPWACYAGAGFNEIGRGKRNVVYQVGGKQKSLDFNIIYFKKPGTGKQQIVLWGFLLSTKRATGNTYLIRLENLFQKITKKRYASCMKIQIDLGIIKDQKRQMDDVVGFLEQLLPYLDECFPSPEENDEIANDSQRDANDAQ